MTTIQGIVEVEQETASLLLEAGQLLLLTQGLGGRLPR